eukprot:m51a1_g4778 putative digestive organ expansion factor-like (747) ;mRNA; f:40341-43205
MKRRGGHSGGRGGRGGRRGGPPFKKFRSGSRGGFERRPPRAEREPVDDVTAQAPEDAEEAAEEEAVEVNPYQSLVEALMPTVRKTTKRLVSAAARAAPEGQPQRPARAQQQPDDSDAGPGPEDASESDGEASDTRSDAGEAAGSEDDAEASADAAEAGEDKDDEDGEDDEEAEAAVEQEEREHKLLDELDAEEREGFDAADEFCRWHSQQVPSEAEREAPRPAAQSWHSEALGTVVCEGERPAKRRWDEYRVKGRVAAQWEKTFREQHPARASGTPATRLQAELFPMLNSYRDVLYCGSTLARQQEIMQAYSLHLANHLLKQRDVTARTDAAIYTARQNRVAPEYEPDQGFTRAKALVISPFRSIAYKQINTFLEMLPPGQKTHVTKKAAFREQYYDDCEPPRTTKYQRPEEYYDLFSGNTDDCYVMGVCLTRQSVRLASDFYRADVIFASPLGLKLIIGDVGDRKRDYDFLSSVEMVIVDRADVIMMQNWEHILTVFSSLNLTPLNPHETDFSRVRKWFLESQGHLFRQNIIISSVAMPEINGLFNRYCHNIRPRIRIFPDVGEGSISLVAQNMRQIFQRVDCTSFQTAADDRFKYFVDQVLPQYKSSIHRGVAVYVASYFDYIRLRNYMKKEELEFSAIYEHADDKDVLKARAQFCQGRKIFLLLTERFHFYHRYQIRGIRSIIFYGLPQYGDYYPEFLNTIHNEDASSMAIYTPYEKLQLERIVGSSRAEKLLSSDKTTHLFC